MEEWKEIKDFPNFMISNFGNVKNIRLNSIKIPQIDYKGYERVQLYQKDGSKNFRIHRLVGLYFIDNPNNYTNIDHIDGNKTNNNINNLRWCSPSQNSRNTKKQINVTSKYKGVYFVKSKNGWIAQIGINYKQIWLGRYKTEDEAGLAYNKYIEENNLSEFFRLNSIEKSHTPA